MSQEENEEEVFLKVGTMLGRYTDIELSFKRVGEKVYVKTGQGVNLTDMVKDLFEILSKDRD